MQAVDTGIPQQHRGNYSIYAVADQMVWADPQEFDRTINLFTRAMGTPQTNRNLIDFSLNFGMTFHEPFLHRDVNTLVKVAEPLPNPVMLPKKHQLG